MNCPKCGGDMWDNREKKKNPKAPDFKCKDSNCDGVVWPPRGARQSAPPSQYQRSAPKDPRGNGGKEGYWERKEAADIAKQPRIERQHAQEMAIRYVALAFRATDINYEKLRIVIDWFQRDVGRVPVDLEREHAVDPTTTPDEEIPF